MGELLSIDGAHGEGGGQVLRTALSLAAATGRPLRIERIRAQRRNPGLAAQHLAAVRATARLCDAEVRGDALGSQAIEFVPRGPVAPGAYEVDVAQVREGGSAGAVTLILQTLFLPLALAGGPSSVILRGGTHVPHAPPFDYLEDVWLPILADMGVHGRIELVRSGWYPAGEGRVRAEVGGSAGQVLRALQARERGAPEAVRVRARAAKLPLHIAERMARHAGGLLEEAGFAVATEYCTEEASSPGAALSLAVRYGQVRAGFNALGVRGKPAEQVAEEAVMPLLAHRNSGAALDAHLADQMILACALAAGESCYTTERVTRHLLTCAWVVEQFGLARIRIDPPHEGKPGTVAVTPHATR
jgi:RNA 3'-terminal phosphate cyclase (ATP)